MRWRDIRFEKPTKADGDSNGYIVQRMQSGSVLFWNYKNTEGCIAWMPLSELPAFDPIPDPPEGWRWADKSNPFDKRAKFWSEGRSEWILTQQLDNYDPSIRYIVPIDPPASQYRPFANAKEFAPHRDRWIRTPAQETIRQVIHYSDRGVDGMTYRMLFEERTFDDGSPCGVKVEPFEP
jgi:hypothetical protein